MKTTLKKIASLLICLCLIISGMVITASAAQKDATLSFANKAQRTSFSTSQQVWEQNGITFTNNKSSSTNPVADYAAPVRLYAHSQVVIELASGTIKTIVFNANSSSYATALKTSIGSAASASSKVVTVSNINANSFTISDLTGQVRLDSIVVTYEEATTEPDPTPNPEEPGQGGGETPDPTPDPEEPGQGGGETPDQPAGNTATVTFDNTSKRIEFSDEIQVWFENGITVTNNRNGATKVADYSNPARFYKNSIIIVAVSNGKIAQIVFDTNSNDYATDMQNSITSGGTATASGDKVTFVPTTSSESFEFTLSGGQVRMDAITITYAATTEPETPPVTPEPEEPPVTPEPEEPETEIKGTDVEVGSDLTANYVVTVKPEDIEGKTLEMRFTMNGVSDSVECDPAEIVDGTFTFAFEGIGAQCMSDTITAALVSTDNEGNETVHSTVDYRIKDYAQTLLNDTNSSDELKEFVSDMLRYGDAAQLYRNYNLDNLATKDVTGLVEADKEKLPTKADEMSLETTSNYSGGDVYFKSATVRFSNVNSLVIKLNAVTAETKLYVNGDLVELDGATYVTDGINADKYDDTFTFELKEGDELIQTLTYSINAYAFSMQDSSKATMASLARALYAYGASAKAYAETLTTN